MLSSLPADHSLSDKPHVSNAFSSLLKICQLAFEACLTKAYELGFGKPDSDLTYPQAVEIMKWIYILVTPGIFVSVLSRVSSAILLTRIFGREKWFKRFVIGFTGLQVLCGCLLILFVWLQVSPVQGLWDPMLPARRWDPAVKQDMAFLTQCEYSETSYSISYSNR